MLQLHLSRKGYHIQVVYNGTQALEAIQSFQPDILLLDLMLPGLSGAEICRRARTFFDGLIIVITASIDEFSEINLLKYGADDYITKPIKANILLARLEARLRRMPAKETNHASKHKLQLNNTSRRLLYNNREVKLTTSEFEVFSILYANFGHIVSREECCKAVRGIEYDRRDRTVDMRISCLRKNLQQHDIKDIVIKTIRNKGYVLIDT
ncbi:hypothetical protein BIT28_06015 [Photobacterium proteolyticum]|uniref:DNA-binding response regulator n=2 Tax=Photobacterium proteolyticum TaxID=1903952 RepID=A0A1Q9GF14_9GAMM|nr:hypothetical protein BIT28_06015 [Photobacterium proteolyticum]